MAAGSCRWRRLTRTARLQARARKAGERRPCSAGCCSAPFFGRRSFRPRMPARTQKPTPGLVPTHRARSRLRPVNRAIQCRTFTGRVSRSFTKIVGWSGTPRATTTAPSPTTPRRSSSIRNTPLAYNNRGNACDAKGDHDRAIADYTEAIRLDPKYACAYNNRGLAWRAKGDHDRAIADYTEAIRLDPKYAVAYYNRGRAWRRQGRPRPRHRRLHRGDPARSEIRRRYNNRGMPGTTRATTTAPSPTTPRRSGSIRNTPSPTTTAASPRTTRATTTAPSPTTPRRSGSIRNTPSPTTTAASPGAPRATTTAPSPTTPRRSGSIRNSRSRSTTAARLARQGRFDRAIADYNRGHPARSEKCDLSQRPLLGARHCQPRPATGAGRLRSVASAATEPRQYVGQPRLRPSPAGPPG